MLYLREGYLLWPLPVACDFNPHMLSTPVWVLQVPVQTITGGLAAGLKGGVLQARALLKQAATTVADKATDVSEAARQRMASNANLQQHQQQTSGGGGPPSVEGSSASMSSASIMSRVQSMARGISSEQQKG